MTLSLSLSLSPDNLIEHGLDSPSENQANITQFKYENWVDGFSEWLDIILQWPGGEVVQGLLGDGSGATGPMLSFWAIQSSI